MNWKTGIFAVLLFTAPKGHCQNQKSLDFASVFAKNKVASRTCCEIVYRQGMPVDTFPLIEEHFDAAGRIIWCQEYFARGRRMAEYWFHYDTKGIPDSEWVATAFNDFRKESLVLMKDLKNRVCERILPESFPSFWKSEKFVYNDFGVLVKSTRYYSEPGDDVNAQVEIYPPSIQVNEKSLSHIYDSHGLPLLFRMFDNYGSVERVHKWEYIFR